MGQLAVPSVSQSRILVASAIAILAPADLLLNTLVSIPIAGGLMGLNGILRIITLWNIASAGSSTKIININFGGATSVLNFSSNSTLATIRVETEIANRNLANSQIANSASNAASFGLIAGNPVPTAVNTALDQNILIRGQKLTVAADTIRLDSYRVELLTP